MYTFNKMITRLWPVLALAACIHVQPTAASESKSAPTGDYILWYRNYDNPAIRNLVELALRKTSEYGEFQIIRSEEISQGGRASGIG